MPDDQNVHPMWSDRKLDEVLAALHADAPAASDARARVRAKLMLAANADAAPETFQPKPTRTRTRRAMPLAGVAAAVAVVAVGAVLIVNAASQQSAPATIPPASSTTAPIRPPATQGSQHAPMPPTPGQTQNTVGGLASRIPDTPPLATHQYLYVARKIWQRTKDQGRSGTTYAYVAEAQAELWIPADQQQLWLSRAQTTGNRQWITGTEQAARADGVDLNRNKLLRPDGEQRARCGDFAPERGKQPCEENPAGTVPTMNGPLRPPTDPRELYEWLVQNSATHPDPPLEFFRTASFIFDGRYPADLRRATLRALSYHPYLVIADASAKDGRPAISIGIDYGPGGSLREEVLLDPVNGQLIGKRTVCLEDVDGAKAGDILRDEVRHQAVVNKLGDKPTN